MVSIELNEELIGRLQIHAEHAGQSLDEVVHNLISKQLATSKTGLLDTGGLYDPASTAQPTTKQESLAPSEQATYRDWYEHALDMYATVDGNTTELLACNQTLAIMFGSEAAEMTGRQLMDLFSPESHEELLALLRRSHDTTEMIGSEALKMILPGAIPLDVRANVRTIPNPEKSGHSYQLVMRDITESMIIENALYFIAHQRWRQYGGTYLEAVVSYLSEVLNADYAFVDEIVVNRQNRVRTYVFYSDGSLIDPIEYDLAGTPCENVIGRILCVYPQAVQQRFPDDLALKDMEAESYAGIPLWDSRRQPLGLLGIISRKPMLHLWRIQSLLQLFSVSVAHELERLHNEKARQDAEMLAQTTLDSMSERIAIIDKNGVILAVNEAWREFARSEDGRDNINPDDNYLDACENAQGEHKEDAKWFASGVRAVISGQRETFSMEYECHTADEKRWFLGRVTRFPGSDPQRVVVAHENITQRRLIEQEIENSLDFEKLVATVSAVLLNWSAQQNESLMEQVLRLIGEYFDIDRVALCQFPMRHELVPPSACFEWQRPGAGTFLPYVSTHRSQIPLYERPKDSTIITLLTRDLPDYDRELRQSLVQQGINSRVILQLFSEDQLIGGITLDSARHVAPWWTDGLLEQLHVLADIIVSAVMRRRIETNLQQRNAELEALLNIALSTGGSFQLREMMSQFLKQLALLIPYTSATIVLLQDGNTDFVMNRGVPTGLDISPITTDSPEHDTLIKAVIRSRKPMVVNDVSKESRWITLPGLESIRSWMGVPLLSGERVLGTVNIAHDEQDHFTGQHIRRATAISQILAISVENARLVQNLEQRVTEQTQSLRESEERHRMVSEVISDYAYLIEISSQGTAELVWVTGAFKPITGYEADDIETLPGGWMSLIHPLDHAFVEAGRDSLPQSLVREYQITTNDGQKRWLRDYVRPMWGKDGRGVIQQYGAVQDVTEQKHAEEALFAQKQQSETILHNVADAIMFTDMDGAIRYVNPAWEQLFGYTLDEVQGKNPRILRHNSTSIETYKELWSTILAGDIWSGVIINKSKSGTSHDVLATIVPVRDAAGLLQHFVAVYQDVTEQRQLAAMKAQFIANAAHDLANPVAVLGTSLHILRRHPDQLDKRMRILEQQVDRLNVLINDLLTVSRLDRRMMVPNFEPVIPHALISRIIEAQEALAAEKRLVLDFRAEMAETQILADPDHMERIVVNLITNAINYTPDGGKVTIRLYQSEQEIIFAITDTGIGISPGDMPHIFDPFYRASNAQSTAFGTGLGLAIVQEIVKLHQGWIEVESELEIGTEFRVHFPMKPALRMI